MCNYVESGNRVLVVIWDVGDEKSPVRHHSENIYLELGAQDTYTLGWMDVARNSAVNPNDEVGMFWLRQTKSFQFKVLRHGVLND